MKWNKGATVAEKEEGCGLVLKGLKSLKIWIASNYFYILHFLGENDPGMKEYLNNMYN
jgi:hypothetical protein